jgi:hypothetical protein
MNSGTFVNHLCKIKTPRADSTQEFALTPPATRSSAEQRTIIHQFHRFDADLVKIVFAVLHSEEQEPIFVFTGPVERPLTELFIREKRLSVQLDSVASDRVQRGKRAGRPDYAHVVGPDGVKLVQLRWSASPDLPLGQ